MQKIKDSKKVKITNMGHIIEVMAMEKLSLDGFPITKLTKDEYMVNGTGEVKKYKHTENRSQNTENLRRTFKKLRNLINNNFSGEKNELAFTITYDENMTDSARLMKDVERFIKKLRYRYPDAEYLNVVEPHASGVWHCHVLLKFTDHEKIYIPNKEIAEMWGHGFVTVKAIRQNVDNLGAYLSAYLGDVELTQENVIELYDKGITDIRTVEKEVEGQKKRFIKGGRLHFYPTGMNIYRKSKGIKEPEIEWVSYSELKKIVGTTTPNYSTTINISDDENNQVNSIYYEHYNLKRESNKE